MVDRPQPSLSALPLEELAVRLGSRARAAAVRRWLYGTRPLPRALPARIPGVAAEALPHLGGLAPLPAWRELARTVSRDGTVKLALESHGARFETVLIPSRDRSTVCVSSQAGCTRSCRFCATATLGFDRPLAADEIVLQYLLAAQEAPPGAPARNVVFMGMGEPMDNLDAVMAAVDLLLERPQPALSARHVTVSTSGVLPGLRRFLREGRGQLALSLNATTDAQREALMPHNRSWPIGALLEALREDQARGSGRRYFIEYVLWAGVNDTDADAERLGALLRGLQAHVNLIPHNPWGTDPRRPPEPARVARFQERVRSGGLRCLVREPRGRDVAAACGQLALAGAAAPPA
jgi:23S rRNA (adenine2503-C2)-methyltransferase